MFAVIIIALLIFIFGQDELQSHRQSVARSRMTPEEREQSDLDGYAASFSAYA